MTIQTIAVLLPLPESALAKLQRTFKTVHYYPSFQLPPSAYSDVELVFTSNRGIPPEITCLTDLPKLKHIQLGSAGADQAISCPAVQGYLQLNASGVTLSTASGTHVLSIPNYVVACVIGLYHQLPSQILFARNQARWCMGSEIDGHGAYYVRKTHGNTAALLGYGAIGRETARLLKAHGMRIIAANTSGTASKESEYVIPGTGDKDGSVPDEYFSTNSAGDLDAFLKQADVLVCSLPSTPTTRYLLTRDKLALMPKDALLINVGRGDLVKSEDLLAALDAPNGLFGAAIDVTDPEPLPTGHALWKHPKCIVTPHLSGDTEGEFDIATDIAIANAERLSKGEKPYNLVDLERGY